MNQITLYTMNEEYEDYLKDESRKVGSAESISFPMTQEEIKQVLKTTGEKKINITMQGARTGIAAGAVPFGGHILNLSRMNKIKGLRYDEESDSFFVTVQPGVLLADLREVLEKANFDTENWTDESKASLNKYRNSGLWFFPPDPTETSASIGGMVSSNASGARSFFYGPTRNYVESLRVVLSDGSSLHLKRGGNVLEGRSFSAKTDSGRIIEGRVPAYMMPCVKNAFGYFCEDNMDLMDLFIGSEGTLGIITEIEVRLIKAPRCIWAIMAFFSSQKEAVTFVRGVRGEKIEQVDMDISWKPDAIEYFNSNALELLRNQKESNPAFAEIPNMPKSFNTAIYIEYHAGSEDEVEGMAVEAAEALELCGGSGESAWMATNPRELERMKFFRHAVPEAVNLLIDSRKKKEPGITKLGTDMAVPDKELEKILGIYRQDLDENNLDSAIFGHIGQNHVHVNIIPKNLEEYNIGKELYTKWAGEVISMGGTVSAEHGIGKLKTGLLKEMYGEEGIGKCVN